MNADHIRDALDAMGTDGLAAALRVGRTRARAGGNVRAACPIHAGDNPDAFVLSERDGRVLWYCHTGCGRGGDALSLVAAVHQLDVVRDFPEVLKRAAAIAGVLVEHKGAHAPRTVPRPPTPAPPRYPDRDDVLVVWNAGRAIRSNSSTLPCQVSRWLASRGLDGEGLHARRLIVGLDRDPDLPSCCGLPAWASRWWWGGYRAILPLYDVHGMMRSLRARRVQSRADAPKALAPKGYAVAGLVLATLPALRWLRGYDAVDGLVVVEGETDFLTAATAWPSYAIVGLVAGSSWTTSFAAKVPVGARVLLATDGDGVGDRYAAKIGRTLSGKCSLRRRAGL